MLPSFDNLRNLEYHRFMPFVIVTLKFVEGNFLHGNIHDV